MIHKNQNKIKRPRENMSLFIQDKVTIKLTGTLKKKRKKL